MSGETERYVSGWTTDTLHAHLVELLHEHSDRFHSEIRRVDERFATFLNTYDRDQDKANEFRAALDDLGKQMATRRESETALKALSERLDEQQRQIGDLRSRLDIGPAGLSALQAGAARSSGQREGSEVTAAAMYRAIAASVGVIGLLIVAANLLTSH